MRWVPFAACSIAIALLACGADPRPTRATPATAAATTSPATTAATATAEPAATDATPAPRNEPAGASGEACDASLPPLDLLRDNVAATAISGVAEIVASAKTDMDGRSPAPASGYVRFRYEVRVLRWLRGAGPETLVLRQTAEAAFSPRAPGHLLFFSACRAPDGEAYEPDVGYFFPVAPACRAEAERLGADAAGGAGKRGSARACRPPAG